jgi:hypothetical protein
MSPRWEVLSQSKDRPHKAVAPELLAKGKDRETVIGEEVGRAGIVALDTGEHLGAALYLEVVQRLPDQLDTYTNPACLWISH